MKTTYERTVKEISLEDNVESYRTYLIGGFMAIEFVFIQFLDIDFKGFTSQQMMMMSKYEKLLVELGERSYNRWGMNLPVEVRLIGFILLQAGIFYIAKLITEKAGSNAAEIFRGMTGQPNVTSKSQEQSDVQEEAPVQPKKKMRGPSIKVDDIRKMATD
jgi:hypothetical protein